MKICLIRPRFPSSPSNFSLNKPDAYYSGQRPYPPFGLLTLAAYMKDHEVTICDMQLPNWKLPVDSDVYVISAFSPMLQKIHDLIDTLKRINPKAQCFVGGPGVTYNLVQAKTMLSNADMIYAGEGEHFAINFTDYLHRTEKVQVCPQPYNWVPHELARWDLVDYKFYAKTRGLTIETSRGCCFSCTYCTASLITGKWWRPRKPVDVIDELKILSNLYGAKKIHFTDDNATVDPERWLALMKGIAEANLNLELTVPEGIQAHHLDFETLKAMKAAGLTTFTIGAESGNQRVLDEVIHKGGLTVERIEQVVRDAVKLGMKPSCFFMIGILGETLDECKQTVAFANKMRKLGASTCRVRNAIPMPGTKMMMMAKEQGCLTVPVENLVDFDFVHSGKHFMKTSEWTPRQIECLVAEARIQEGSHGITFTNLVHHPRATLKHKIALMQTVKKYRQELYL
jgi:radical SAM superfamily enzyme YgiQ (UPF0313 family)